MGRVLAGPTGTGKSHLCALAAHLMIGKGADVRWVHWPTALREAKGKMGKDLGVWPPPEWVSADLLILDEIGAKGDNTPWAINTLTGLLGSRYDTGRCLFFATSNLSPEELDEELGDAAWSRVKSMAHITPLSGSDRRELEREADPL